MPIFPTMTPAAIRSALRARTEIALLDVRQESRFARGHPLFAASFPLGHLEAQAAERLPRRTVPVAVYGDGDDAAAAARRGWARSGGRPGSGQGQMSASAMAVVENHEMMFFASHSARAPSTQENRPRFFLPGIL